MSIPWNKPSRGTPPQQSAGRTLKRRFCRSCGWSANRCWRPWRQETGKSVENHGNLGKSWENNGKVLKFQIFETHLCGSGWIWSWPHVTSLEWWELDHGNYPQALSFNDFQVNELIIVSQPDGCICKWGNTRKQSCKGNYFWINWSSMGSWGAYFPANMIHPSDPTRTK